MSALELAARALVPGSALPCLDAIAGDVVEDACEKAIFASPEATAAAVSATELENYGPPRFQGGVRAIRATLSRKGSTV